MIDMDYKLFDFLINHETGVEFDKNERELKGLVHVPYSELDDFLEIIKPQYESYPMAELQGNSACIILDNIYDFDIYEYLCCFNADDFKDAQEAKRKYELRLKQ
jgi:hypothetical protein